MSHFVVMVFGADPEHELAPFHEFECTGRNDEFVQEVDRTEEVQADIDASLAKGATPEDALDDALSNYGWENKRVASESEVDREEDHKYGWAVVVDGKLVKAVDRTNPNKEWDWWVLGGRWSNLLLLKNMPGAEGVRGIGHKAGPGETCDSALKCHIDFEGMREAARQSAGAIWDRTRAATGGQGWEVFSAIRGRICGEGDAFDGSKMHEARKAYRAQPAVVALQKHDEFGRYMSFDAYAPAREVVVEAAGRDALMAYAMVKDRQWAAKGEMGWFGMSRDAVSDDAWATTLQETIDALPDDTRVSMIDCHI